MDQRQINRLEMYQAVQTFMDTNTNIWNSVPILVTFKNELDELLVQINENKDTQEASRVYLGSNKTTQKRFVSEKGDILNDALEAYAAIESNAVLEQKAAKSFTDLYSLRNQDFVTVVTETISLLDQNITPLGDYGVTQDQITDLKNSFDSFLVLNGEPRQYRIAQKQATATLSDLFDQTSTLLNSKIDKVMKRFKRANTTFYNGYLAARIIVGN
ncbi:hypothetical protein ATE84_4536 [Aquimarina sp. MAR_2010_214]|uniref:hypothetical protein n=1 Tax=Aquimarina sp. MAR_2010_214 TaxID=1250026 RepID=UPI000C713B36|nr:hypothetical protein [Aquimarina sp. MAR_2010_214]PKV52421.1 hypothetical protein ATE84_4536 [Aquimarina sp. MAR_2010_214]